MVLFTVSGSGQQTPTTLMNSREVIATANKLYDNQKYDEAVLQYKSISRNDSNYYEAMAQLASAYLESKQEQSAIDLCRECLKQNSAYGFYFSNTLGNALSETKRYDEAIAVYKRGLEKFKHQYMLSFNAGLAFLNSNRVDSAINYFQFSILQNPFHAAAHYELGMCYLQQGRSIPAMLALGFYLGIEPASERSKEVVLRLDKLAAGDNGFDKTKSVDQSKLNVDAFSELEILFTSKLALKRKSKSKLNFPISKQMQMIMEKLEYNSYDKGFCMQHYVPFFKQMYADKQFETYSHLTLASVNIDEVAKWNKKNKKKIDAFAIWENKRIVSQFDNREEFINGKLQMVQHFFYSDGNLQAIGNIKNGKISVGDWEFFTRQGALSAKGSFTENGERTGKWYIYNDDGSLKEIDNFKLGMKDGICDVYYVNGALAASYNYKNDKLDGMSKDYYPTGEIKEINNFTGGIRNGPVTHYHPNGKVMYVSNYKNDSLDGGFIQSYPNGSTEIDLDFVNGKKNGNGSYWYKGNDNRFKQKGSFKNNLQIGKWEMFYKSGRIQSVSNYNEKGMLTGVYRFYHRNGKIGREVNYDEEGKLNGWTKEFAEDGTLSAEVEYKADTIMSYKSFDKSGKQLAGGGTLNKKIVYSTMYQNGNKRAEGEYVNGKREGPWIFYDVYGSIIAKENYVADKLNGRAVEYYDNGLRISEVEYEEGFANGYFRGYYKNGEIKTEGFYRDGLQEGEWKTYFVNGKLASRNYFVGGSLDGWQEYFTPLGRKDKELFYHLEFLSKALHYDSLGKIADRIELDHGDGDYVLHFPDEKIKYKAKVLNGRFEGKATAFNIDGSIIQEGIYENDAKEGEWKTYLENGKLDRVLNYSDDVLSGTSKWFYPNGELFIENNYYDGSVDSSCRVWHDNKLPERETFYADDKAQGTFSYYSPDGQLQCKRTFDEDVLVSYTYPDKTGKMIPELRLPNETGKMECFFANGKKSFEQELAKGIPVGHRKEYFSSGVLYRDDLYVEGTRNGSCKFYYANSKLKSEETYFMDSKNGACKYYYDNGQLEMEGSYILDDRNGDWKYYDKSGKLVAVKTFVLGVVYAAKKI